MNKYQRALDCFHYKCLTEIESDEMAKILQELIDKDTPKKPYMDIFNAWCPNCKAALGREFAISAIQGYSGRGYCPNCGQALKWREEEENEE